MGNKSAYTGNLENKGPKYPDSATKNYVYLTSLQSSSNEKARALYASGHNLVTGARDFFSGSETLELAYANLQGLVNRERSAEKKFLSDNLKGVTEAEINAYGFKELIDNFNTILSFKTTYKTNIARILAMEKGDIKNGQVDRLYALLNYTFPSEMKKLLTELMAKDFEKLITGGLDGEITKKAEEVVIRYLNQVYGDKGSATEDYKEFSQLLQNLISQGDLIQKILRGYGMTPEQLRKTLDKEKEKRKGDLSNIKAGNLMLSHQGGNVFEIIINEILANLSGAFNGSTIATGSLNNMKADHVITIGINNAEQLLREEVEKQKGQGERSNRIKNIEAIENFFDDIEKVRGSIIFVSDKNYRLNSKSFAEDKGFAAESPTFKNFGKVMAKAGGTNIEDLIFLLANTGDGRINQETGSIERYIATKIGNFLFDDVAITESLDTNSSSVNRIHVFNLGNIYVPLSVFLEASLNALRNIESDYTDFIKIQINTASLSYSKQKDGLTMSDWDNLFNNCINSGTVSMHFFGSFINFISQYLG